MCSSLLHNWVRLWEGVEQLCEGGDFGALQDSRSASSAATRIKIAASLVFGFLQFPDIGDEALVGVERIEPRGSGADRQAHRNWPRVRIYEEQNVTARRNRPVLWVIMQWGYVDQLTRRCMPNCMVHGDEVAGPGNVLHHAIMEHPAEQRAATLLFRLTDGVLKTSGRRGPSFRSMNGKTKWFPANGASERFQMRLNIEGIWGGGFRHEKVLLEG